MKATKVREAILEITLGKCKIVIMKSIEVEVRRSVFTFSSFPSHGDEKDEVVTKFCET